MAEEAVNEIPDVAPDARDGVWKAAFGTTFALMLAEGFGTEKATHRAARVADAAIAALAIYDSELDSPIPVTLTEKGKETC